MNVQILKCLIILLKLVPTLMETLSKEGLISPITDFLLEISAKKLKASTVMPTAWLEAKATNIRALCTEQDKTLCLQQKLKATLIQKKQLVFNQILPNGNEIDFNVHLLSAINLYKVMDDTTPCFSVHMDHTSIETWREKPAVPNGLVLMDSESLLKLDSQAMSVLQSS